MIGSESTVDPRLVHASSQTPHPEAKGINIAFDGALSLLPFFQVRIYRGSMMCSELAVNWYIYWQVPHCRAPGVQRIDNTG